MEFKILIVCFYTLFTLKKEAITFCSMRYLVQFTICATSFKITLFNPLPYRKVIVCKTNKREDKETPILPYAPLASFPPLLFFPPLSPATFICCPINNSYCSFNYAPVISKSGGHVSSPSQGSLGNYQHPSKGRCSCSLVAVAIITLPSLTAVHWARSPSGLSLSHHAILSQFWPLTSPKTLQP